MLISRIHWNDPNYVPRGFQIEPRLAPAFATYRRLVARLATGDELTPDDRQALEAAAMAVGADGEDVEADTNALNRTRELENAVLDADERRDELDAATKRAGARLKAAREELLAAQGAVAQANGKMLATADAAQALTRHRAQHPHLYVRLDIGAGE